MRRVRLDLETRADEDGMTAIKITVDAAMRARDVSRPESAAEESGPADPGIGGQADRGVSGQPGPGAADLAGTGPDGRADTASPMAGVGPSAAPEVGADRRQRGRRQPRSRVRGETPGSRTLPDNPGGRAADAAPETPDRSHEPSRSRHRVRGRRRLGAADDRQGQHDSDRQRGATSPPHGGEGSSPDFS